VIWWGMVVVMKGKMGKSTKKTNFINFGERKKNIKVMWRNK
jgi:hypothetical protein